MKRHIVGIVVLVAVCAGTIAGYYATTAGMADDKRTVSDLEQIRTKIEAQAEKDNELPKSFSDLELSNDIKERTRKYEYKTLDRERYELCATFRTEIGKPLAKESEDGYPRFSKHGKGRQCFSNKVSLPERRRTIDRDRFKNNEESYKDDPLYSTQ